MCDNSNDHFAVSRIAQWHPLVHINSNVVTLHEVVSAVLAVGGTAIGASAPEEAEEITAIADALVINIGTPDKDRERSMLLSGCKANEKGIPVVLDPVGAGASAFRRHILQELLTNVHFTCIRGNNSEIAALYDMSFPSSDRLAFSDEMSADGSSTIRKPASGGVEDTGMYLSDAQLQQLASVYHTTVAASGAQDRIAYETGLYRCSGGTPMLKRITGAGCMLSGILAAGLATVDITDDLNHKVEGKKLISDHLDINASSVSILMQRYKDDALLAEQDMHRDGRNGVGSFLTYLLDRLSSWPKD